jgi:membrane protein
VFGTIPLPWSELIRRTYSDALEDDVLGLAAQLSYYFFLALFPAILFLLAIASFFSLTALTDDLAQSLGPFVSPEVLELIQEQMRRLANNESGGLLTFGVAGAVWSSSAALVSIVSALNRAYDIEEGRPWWKVRLLAMGLTLGAAVFVLVALSLVLLGPTVAEFLGNATGLGKPFEWTWLVLQWPLVFLLVTTALGLIYYFGPDAEQDWAWITPGAVAATLLWLVASLLFKIYIAKFTDYNAAYGTVGGVIVLLLWFYVSSLAVLAGAELNAEIEHASPYGKAPGQKNDQGRVLLGRRAERAFREQQSLRAKAAEKAPKDVAGSAASRSADEIEVDSREGGAGKTRVRALLTAAVAGLVMAVARRAGASGGRASADRRGFDLDGPVDCPTEEVVVRRMPAAPSTDGRGEGAGLAATGDEQGSHRRHVGR